MSPAVHCAPSKMRPTINDAAYDPTMQAVAFRFEVLLLNQYRALKRRVRRLTVIVVSARPRRREHVRLHALTRLDVAPVDRRTVRVRGMGIGVHVVHARVVVDHRHATPTATRMLFGVTAPALEIVIVVVSTRVVVDGDVGDVLLPPPQPNDNAASINPQ